jgi:outer membrane protein assembly factor BamB
MRLARLLAILLPFSFVWQTLPRAGAAPPESPTTKTSSDWPGFLGSHRNGKSDEHRLPTNWPPKGPPVVWHKTVGTGYSAPAISGGKLFHFSRTKNSAQLKCFNAESGAELWTCEYPTDFVDMLGYNNGPRATPVVDGPNVYTFGAEGVLQCVRISDGHPVWRIDTTKQFNVVKNFFGVGSTPLVWNDLLLVNVGGSPPGGPTDVYAADGKVDPSGSAIVAFDKKTGAVRWQTGNDLASYSSPVVTKIAGRDIIFMFARSGLLAIDPAKGQTIAQFPWRARRLESVNASTPVVVGNEIFISETYELGSALVRFNGAAFQEIWTDRDRRRNQAMALHWNTPIETGGYLYGSSGYHTEEAELRCVDWKTGKVMWSEPNMGRSSLLLVDSTLVCLSEDGALRMIKPTPERYTEIAKWELTADDGTELLPHPAWAAPALSHGLLYVEGASRLVCLKLIPSR